MNLVATLAKYARLLAPRLPLATAARLSYEHQDDYTALAKDLSALQGGLLSESALAKRGAGEVECPKTCQKARNELLLDRLYLRGGLRLRPCATCPHTRKKE